MDFAFTPAQVAFRDEIRAFCRQEVTPAILAETGGVMDVHHDAFYQKLAARGWVGIQWPREYGGQGRSCVDMVIFYEEMAYAGAPLGRYTGSVVFVGQSIIHYGSDGQKRHFLPRIAAGELLCCWCLSEPNAGSDAAAIQTRAEADGDGFILNGQKVFISGAHLAQVAMVAVRTDPNSTRHKGLSLLLVDMDSPGITVRPLWTMAGWRVNEVYFDQVRVPAARLLGQQDNGWRHIMTTLGFERFGISAVGHLLRRYHRLQAHLNQRHATGLPVDPGLEQQLMDLRLEMEAARLMTYRVAWLQDQGRPAANEASMAKVLTAELSFKLGNLGMELLGPGGLALGAEAPDGGGMEYLYRAAQFYVAGGGTSEIQRTVVATRGLGVPAGPA